MRDDGGPHAARSSEAGPRRIGMLCDVGEMSRIQRHRSGTLVKTASPVTSRPLHRISASRRKSFMRYERMLCPVAKQKSRDLTVRTCRQRWRGRRRWFVCPASESARSEWEKIGRNEKKRKRRETASASCMTRISVCFFCCE